LPTIAPNRELHDLQLGRRLAGSLVPPEDDGQDVVNLRCWFAATPALAAVLGKARFA
jgi:hypothetical protein